MSDKSNGLKTDRLLNAKLGARLAGALTLIAVAAAHSQTYSVLRSFTVADGQHPGATLVSSGETLFGVTSWGGTSNFGTVFKLKSDGTGHTVLQHFQSPTHTNGAVPAARLVLAGSTLYGTTEAGGQYGVGTVFRLSTNGTGFTVIRAFNAAGNQGIRPRAGLVLSGSTLYGTTYGRPPPPSPYSYGSTFKLNTDGSGYAVVTDFSLLILDNGKHPSGEVLLSGGMLYGTTSAGGIANRGTVFRVSTNGASYAILKDFAGSDGAGPRGNFALLENTLYGTTQSGGSSNLGTIFKINTSGTGFSVLKNFTGSEGATPVAGLMLSGRTLYGTTYAGGSSNLGTVFKLNADGTGFAVIKHFTGSDGANPVGGLELSSGSLYGTTYYGGHSTNGVVFRINLSPVVTVTNFGDSIPLTWTAIAGLTYQVQYKMALSQPSWSNLGEPITATNSTMTLSDAIGSEPQRYYRVLLPQ